MMMKPEESQLLPLVHNPIHPARTGTPGEGIYLQLWREYVAADEGRLAYILGCVTNEPNQRDASVCASFMVYMGCNGGQGFTHSAEIHAKQIGHRSDGFLAAWAIDNKRRSGINSGLRTIEFILAEQHPICAEGFNVGRVAWDLVPDITMRDIDVIEAMVVWWSDLHAEKIRKIAEPLRKAQNEKLLSGIFGAAEVPA
jgi:hypothetical protein